MDKFTIKHERLAEVSAEYPNCAHDRGLIRNHLFYRGLEISSSDNYTKLQFVEDFDLYSNKLDLITGMIDALYDDRVIDYIFSKTLCDYLFIDLTLKIDNKFSNCKIYDRRLDRIYHFTQGHDNLVIYTNRIVFSDINYNGKKVICNDMDTIIGSLFINKTKSAASLIDFKDDD